MKKTVYDAAGVETAYDYVKMKPMEIYQDFGSLDNYFNGTFVTSKCLGTDDYKYRHAIAEKRHLDRISIDIARTASYIDTAPTMNSMEPKEYAAYTQLSSDAGLREMHPVPTDDPYPSEVIIPELTPAEIEQLIAQEKDPAVQESLRRWSQGRDQLHYYSKEDQYFKRTGFEERTI